MTSVEPLSTEEVMAILAACDLDSGLGMRDHALFSVMWQGCLTFFEASGLLMDHLATDYSYVILHGRSVSRMVSLSAEAQKSLRRYAESVRPQFVRFHPDEPAVFLTGNGTPYAPGRQHHPWARLIGPYLKKTRILKNVRGHALKWARVKALAEQGVSKDELRALAGYSKWGFDGFMRRIGR